MGFDLYAIGDESEARYFRATNSGMAELRAAMDAVGIIDPRVPDYDEWPAPPDGYAERVDSEEPLTETDIEYEQRLRRARSIGSDHPGRVLGWKLLVNEGWVVTPEECAIIADALEFHCDLRGAAEQGDPEVLEWIRRFAGYCRHCAGRGGFEVW